MQLILLSTAFFYTLAAAALLYRHSKESFYQKAACQKEGIFASGADECLLPRIDSHAPKTHLAIQVVMDRYNREADP